jgi:hypothetical protein
MMGAFDGIVGVYLDKTKMVDRLVDAFGTFAEGRSARQACRVQDDLSGLRWREEMRGHTDGAKYAILIKLEQT